MRDCTLEIYIRIQSYPLSIFGQCKNETHTCLCINEHNSNGNWFVKYANTYQFSEFILLHSHVQYYVKREIVTHSEFHAYLCISWIVSHTPMCMNNLKLKHTQGLSLVTFLHVNICYKSTFHFIVKFKIQGTNKFIGEATYVFVTLNTIHRHASFSVFASTLLCVFSILYDLAIVFLFLVAWNSM